MRKDASKGEASRTSSNDGTARRRHDCWVDVAFAERDVQAGRDAGECQVIGKLAFLILAYSRLKSEMVI